MKPQSQKGIEDILSEKGLLTADQLSAVKFESINSGQPVEKILLDRGYVDSVELVKARGDLFGIPFVQLSTKVITPEILDYVPEPVARKYSLIPFGQEKGSLLVAMEDPLDLQVAEFLEKRTGLRVSPYIAQTEDILQAIESQYGKSIGTEVTAALEEVGSDTTRIEEQIRDINKAEETIRDAPVARIVSAILEYAVKSRASDVHIEPQEERSRVRYRIDGILQERLTLPKNVHPSVCARIKILSNLKIDERRIPQDGRFKVQVGDTKTDLRVSTLPTIFGEKVVIRLLKEQSKVLNFDDLGLRGTSLKRVKEAIELPDGIVLVTGPTGSGKTVTLATCLTKCNTIGVNIITLEDPVEIRVPGVNQVQINPQAGLTFASGLRAILRQDPNIVMVGEIRDEETAHLAIHAALTGHLVLSTLHTNSSAGAIPRLIDMGAEPFLIGSTVSIVIAQRLVRKICPHCKKEYPAPEEIIVEAKEILGPLFPSKNNGNVSFFKGAGCERCDKSGYAGRLGIFEVLKMSDSVRKLTLEKQPESLIAETAIKEGMLTLLQDGYLKVLEGLTTLEEVMRVAQDSDDKQEELFSGVATNKSQKPANDDFELAKKKPVLK
ncbi:type II secretion system protein GspE [candidate division WWE3 bacterium CG08_land_8_20_14_0_20_43_13]|uniref:Type II secretion system protein GspE n=1 Tax=candidate division WWE3 bacterium CG08_land_8_20_14_0_20_43_13 TaxID=1975087 RepID=A0A2H0XA80_UNCKA|nr:MAG: type II secretion system protein GspE [candidate division WWE3 bacterium CG08_land_8_20_14_0_20_43_13]